MKCPRCEKVVSLDSNFCEFCGHNLSIKARELYELSTKIIDHVEFLGYSTNSIEKEEINDVILVKHMSKPSLRMVINDKQGSSMMSIYTMNHEKIAENKNDFLGLINQVNLEVVTCCFSYDFKNQILLCASWYPPEYSKHSFSVYLERHLAEIAMKVGDPRLQEYA